MRISAPRNRPRYEDARGHWTKIEATGVGLAGASRTSHPGGPKSAMARIKSIAE